MSGPYRTASPPPSEHETVYLARPAALGAALHLGIVGAVLILGALLASCSGSAVQRQATSANLMARGWNEVAEPTMVAAFEREQRQAVEHLCPADAAPCELGPLDAAVRAIRASWAPVWASLETVRVAHDAWRSELERCRARGDDAGQSCDVEAQRLGGRFVAEAGVLRCLLRAVGHAELDPFPGDAPSCPFTPASDGGSNVHDE